MLLALGFAVSAEGREGSRESASQPPPDAERLNAESRAAQSEIAENLPDCRKVDVDLDEGYGVTGHATRSECPPRAARRRAPADNSLD